MLIKWLVALFALYILTHIVVALVRELWMI